MLNEKEDISVLNKNIIEIAKTKGKIAAVKAYMDYKDSKIGLKEAKDYVDELTKDVEVYKGSSSKMWVIILLIASIAVIIWSLGRL